VPELCDDPVRGWGGQHPAGGLVLRAGRRQPETSEAQTHAEQVVTDAQPAKPAHLSAEYAAQFGDEAIAAAYQHRPPYPAEAFAIVESLLGARPRRVLELGAGTGDFTIGLAGCVDHLIAVEPSRPMLERGRRRPGAASAHVEWLAVAAEDYAFDRQYSAVVAAEAFHWLDWHRVLPRLAERLAPDGQLVLVQRALAEALPWDPALRILIREFSTNREYVPYDTASELQARGLFTIGGRARTGAVRHRQSIDGYVESFHSRNGFSRARLPAERARAFDDELRTLLGRHCPDDTVVLPVEARIVWGRPIVT
jgi:SAM-dependent methyltransferase